MNFEFIDGNGTFQLVNPEKNSGLYFPIANEYGMKSCVTPLLGGDAKGSQNTFLLQPVSSEDLHNNRSTRNFWCKFKDGSAWSATGVSPLQEAERFSKDKEETVLEAGTLWQKVKRVSTTFNLQSEILSFVPHDAKYIEIMAVTITNIGQEKTGFTPMAAVPIYARSADNLRDHRHVTSLLHRIHVKEEGVYVNPTLTFDERGHRINTMVYGVAGFDEEGEKPYGFYPLTESFIGEGGNFLVPEAVFKNVESVRPWTDESYKDEYCGYEAMGAFEFEECVLKPEQQKTFLIILGMAETEEVLREEIYQYRNSSCVEEAFAGLKAYWKEQNNVSYTTGDYKFDQWMTWVNFQPMLRRIYGCSFLPHHDYGKGGRGCRDLGQDCQALLIMNPDGVRQMLVDNFAGVRFDGSNATIIGEKQGEFIADRNHITRVWMDHGVWPLTTLELYIHQTGDIGILDEKVCYFKDAQIFRGEKYDELWSEDQGCWLCSKDGMVHKTSILEHLILQNVTAFFDVGEHGEIRLRGADWNDAIDMASDRGESVAFTAAYAGNLSSLAELLREYRVRRNMDKCDLSEELFGLLNCEASVYEDAHEKVKLLNNFFTAAAHRVSGRTIEVSVEALADKLQEMSDWMKDNIRKNEWVGDNRGCYWYNGYYDNHGRKVEGMADTGVRMMLTSQVFTIMSKTATDEQVEDIVKSADRYLYDEKIGGYRLNTNFHEIKMDMGRMFGFAYGHKENGAVFSHMAVMYANALYRRGFVKEGYKAVHALYRHSIDFEVSRIYPGIPEYFNQSGRGMYHYLTGAASWLMTTMLTESFGIKGCYGDLLIEPKLVGEQFDVNGVALVSCNFKGRKIKVCYKNPKRKEYGEYRISDVSLNGIAMRPTDTSGKTMLIEADNLAKEDNMIEVYLN